MARIIKYPIFKMKKSVIVLAILAVVVVVTSLIGNDSNVTGEVISNAEIEGRDNTFCTDPDGDGESIYENSIYIQSTVNWKKGELERNQPDRCETSTTIQEVSCIMINNQAIAESRRIKCPNDGSCIDGACIRK